MPSRKSSRTPAPSGPLPRRPAPVNQPPAHEIVDPRWLAKALGLTIVAAVICAWLALCGLYYQGSWQLVLRPLKSITETPAALGIPFQEVRFDAFETGQPRLSGWWIPAVAAGSQSPLQPQSRYAGVTVLYLHDGTGSLSATVPVLGLLHAVGVNIFAIDYRGFGQSDASAHPNAERMNTDGAAALDYLANTRHIPLARIVPYGVGLGGSLAVHLAESHHELPAIILDNPDPDPVATAVGAHPSHLVPIRLLFHEDFEIAGSLQSLRTPKLLLAGGPNAPASQAQVAAIQNLYRHASSPAISVLLPDADYVSEYEASVTRFLDQYLYSHLPGAASPR